MWLPVHEEDGGDVQRRETINGRDGVISRLSDQDHGELDAIAALIDVAEHLV